MTNSGGREVGGVGHEDWDAVGDLPGTRIVRRGTGKQHILGLDPPERRFEFVDESATHLAGEDKGILSTASETYAFSKAGLERVESGAVVLPWPEHTRGNEKYGGRPRWRIELPDGRWMEFSYHRRRSRWSVGKILDESGELLVTLRWTRPGFSLQLNKWGEAIVTPGKVLPTEPIPFVAYAFAVFELLTLDIYVRGRSDAASPPGSSSPMTRPIPDDITGVSYRKGITILLVIVTLGLWGFVWSFRTGDDLKRYNGDGLGGVFNVVIYLLLPIILMFTIPYEIWKMYGQDGQPSPVSTVWGLWFLLPIIGNIIWYLKVQDALNDFWRAKGARTA